MITSGKQLVIPLFGAVLSYEKNYTICDGVCVFKLQQEYKEKVLSDSYWRKKYENKVQYMQTGLKIECDTFNQSPEELLNLGVFTAFSIRLATGIPIDIPLYFYVEHEEVEDLSQTCISTYDTERQYKCHLDDGKQISGFEAIRTGFSEVLTDYIQGGTSNCLVRAIYFAAIGFQNHNIPVRLVNNTTFLEALFTDDNTEVSFRVASAVSWYLRSQNKPEERYQFFTKIKKLYSIRSKIVHGQDINSKRGEMDKFFRFSEKLNTEIFETILKKRHCEIFGMKKNVRREELKKLCLGTPCQFIN